MSTQHDSTDNVINLRWRPTIGFEARLRLVRLDYADRLGRKLNQGQFADLLGVKPGTYASWEAGNTKPEDLIATAHRIYGVTGVDPAWLLDVADDAPWRPNSTPGQEIVPSGWIDRTAGHEAAVFELFPAARAAA
jgi:transcriptional regulator with XRE-family HTH domain